MKTAKQKAKDLTEAGDTVGAMRIVSKWHELGVHKEAITRGWAARNNPDFYRQIGKDPDALWERGLIAMEHWLYE